MLAIVDAARAYAHILLVDGLGHASDGPHIDAFDTESV